VESSERLGDRSRRDHEQHREQEYDAGAGHGDVDACRTRTAVSEQLGDPIPVAIAERLGAMPRNISSSLTPVASVAAASRITTVVPASTISGVKLRSNSHPDHLARVTPLLNGQRNAPPPTHPIAGAL
jgi:hypothetical protein